MFISTAASQSRAYLLWGGLAQPHAGQSHFVPVFSLVAHFTVSDIVGKGRLIGETSAVGSQVVVED